MCLKNKSPGGGYGPKKDVRGRTPRFALQHKSPPLISFFSNVLNIVLNITSPTAGKKKNSECPICCMPMILCSVGQCDDIVCWLCALKMRILRKDTSCAFCKMKLDYIIITEHPGDPSSKKESSPSKTLKQLIHESLPPDYAKLDSYPDERRISKYNLLFLSKQLRDFIDAYIQYTCWHPCCAAFIYEGKYVSFGDSMEDWTNHMITHHKLFPCSICLNKRHLFVAEQFVYHEKSLRYHFYNGDRWMDTFILPHVRCSACKAFCFDLDSYMQHAREEHITCYICDKDATQGETLFVPPCFLNFRYLDHHYEQYHYVCRRCDFLAFSTSAELNVHMLVVHQVKNLELGYSDTRPEVNRTPYRSSLIPYFSSQAREKHKGSNPQYRASSDKRITSSRSSQENPFDHPTETIQHERSTMSNNETFSSSSNAVVLPSSSRLPNKIFSTSYVSDVPDHKSEPSSGFLENCVYYNLDPKEAKEEELRRLLLLLSDPIKDQLSQSHTLVLGLRDFFAHDTNPSLRFQSTWRMKLSRSSPLDVFELFWAKQVNFSNHGYGGRGLHEPRHWSNTWRILFPRVSPGSELFLRLILCLDDSNVIQLQFKKSILNKINVSENSHMPRLPSTTDKKVTDVPLNTSHLSDSFSSPNASGHPHVSLPDAEDPQQEEKKENQQETNKTKTLTSFSVGSNIPFLVALHEASEFFLHHCRTEEIDWTHPDHLALARKIRNRLQHATLKDLTLLSGLMKHSNADEIRRNVADNILSLCAPYFLLAKHHSESTSTSHQWATRCNTVFSMLQPNEWIFFKLYLQESLKLLPIAQLKENYPQLPDEIHGNLNVRPTMSLNYRSHCHKSEPKLSHLLTSHEHFPPLEKLETDITSTVQTPSVEWGSSSQRTKIVNNLWKEKFQNKNKNKNKKVSDYVKR